MRTVSPRLLLVVVLLLSLTGTAVAVAEVGDQRPLEVAAGAGTPTGADAAAGRRPGLMPTTTAAPATTAVSPSTTAVSRPSGTTRTAPRTASATADSAAPATTPTTLDWRAAGLPGPVGSTIQPWTEAPYRRSATGNTTVLSMEAQADGAPPGTVMPMTVRGTFSRYTTGATIVLVGPADYTQPYEAQPHRVIDTWSGECGVPFGPSVERSVDITLPMHKIVKPEFVMNTLHYEVRVLVTPCQGEPYMDAWLTLDFNVDEPFVVVAANPGGLSSTG